MLADEVDKRVVIVDTSNEIAGDGDVPHPGIGTARRMQVRVAAEQHNVMIEAVENHMPEVIVIDEIGTEAEAAASRTIAERGVQLVGTAHGQTLENLMLNPTLADLIGGIQAVTLSDAEAQRRGTQKTVLERKAPPTFDVVIELLDYDRLAVHNDVQKTVDMILRGVPPRPEIRVRTGAGLVEVVQAEQVPEKPPVRERPKVSERINASSERRVSGSSDRSIAKLVREASKEEVKDDANRVVRIFPYGINRSRLERAIREKRAQASVTGEIREADAVMAMRSTQQSNPKKLRDMAGRSVNTVVVKSNTFSQIATALDDLLRQADEGSEMEARALEEAQQGVEAVLQSGKPFELSPVPASIRKAQFRLVESRKLASEGFGEEPQRRLRILPTRI